MKNNEKKKKKIVCWEMTAGCWPSQISLLCFTLQTARCAMLTCDQSTLKEGKHPPLPACESLSFGVRLL